MRRDISRRLFIQGKGVVVSSDSILDMHRPFDSRVYLYRDLGFCDVILPEGSYIQLEGDDSPRKMERVFRGAESFEKVVRILDIFNFKTSSIPKNSLYRIRPNPTFEDLNKELVKIVNKYPEKDLTKSLNGWRVNYGTKR